MTGITIEQLAEKYAQIKIFEENNKKTRAFHRKKLETILNTPQKESFCIKHKVEDDNSQAFFP